MPGRSRGGNAAGNFHPRPGPVSRLPRTGKGHRGGPDDRARPPAGRSQGAIHLLYEALTQRPASRLPQKLDAKAGVEMERLAFSHIKGSEGRSPHAIRPSRNRESALTRARCPAKWTVKIDARHLAA